MGNCMIKLKSKRNQEYSEPVDTTFFVEGLREINDMINEIEKVEISM